MNRSSLGLKLAPVLTLILVTLAAALPWGLAPEWKLAMPLLPFVIVYLWVERRAVAMPDWLIFLAGLATDVLGQGPLGYWALVYLVGFIIVRTLTGQRRPGRLSSILWFGVTSFCLVGLQWLVSSIYTLQLTDIVPLFKAGGLAMLIHAVFTVAFPALVVESRPANDRLARGI